MSWLKDLFGNDGPVEGEKLDGPVGRVAEAMSKLDEAHRKRLKQFVSWDVEKQSRWSEQRGKTFARLFHEEIVVLNNGEFPEELAGPVGASRVHGFVNRTRGEAWVLVATEDELRMTAHEFWLRWLERDHDK